jgi:hypothetical protein
MLRTCLVAITITLMAGLTPASAQGGGNCEQFVVEGRALAAVLAMDRALQSACRPASQSAKQKRASPNK